MASKDNKPLQQLSSNGVSAKELARSLGLVKRRPSSSTSRVKGQENGRKSRQHFAYLIVLDFESTCWKDKKMSYGPEIIEFPAVLLNTSTGELESEFQMFVQPSEHRKLSEFCTELTGITQTQVDEGVPVGTCLMLFGRWLQEMRDQKGFMFPCDQVQIKNQRSQNMESSVKWCTFVTWSDWDLGNCLKNECHRKQLRMPHPLRSWIDLRVTYKNFYSRKPQGLAGALQDLGIKFAGREHSGLDDARNTARLTWRMISDGCVMQITKSIDGMVQNLWNVVMKNGLSQTDSGANNLPGPQISTTEHTRICESLNFIRTQSGVHSGLQVQKGSTLKRKITELGSRDPQDKMTKIKQKELVLRMQENRVEVHDNWRHMGDVKRTASDSNVSFMRCAVPGNITTCLLSPATSLNKTVKESLGFHLRSETPKASAAGLLMKRGLVKQTLRYNQHKPLASHDWQIRLVTEERQRSASTRPCKASNVEPQAMTTPLFRVPVNQTFLADRHQIKEEPYNNDNVKYHSAPREDVLQKVEKKAATVSVEAKNSASRLTTPCAARKLIANAFTPPLCGRVNKTHQASTPVSCFNGGSVTPPLCHCGRRTRRRSVINPGPNQGRAFFACSLNHVRSRLNSSADKKNSKSGCNFFRWEVHL